MSHANVRGKRIAGIFDVFRRYRSIPKRESTPVRKISVGAELGLIYPWVATPHGHSQGVAAHVNTSFSGARLRSGFFKRISATASSFVYTWMLTCRKKQSNFSDLMILSIRDVEAVKFLMLTLPAPLEVFCFRVRFRFLNFGIFCFRKKLTASSASASSASASSSLLCMKQLTVFA